MHASRTLPIVLLVVCLLGFTPLVSADALSLVRMSPTPAFGGDYAIAWTADSDYLAMGMPASPWFATYYVSGSSAIKLSNAVALPTGAINDMRWSPDGQYLAIASNTNPYLSIYQKTGFAESASLTRCPLPVGPASQAFGVAWNGNDVLALASNAVSGQNLFAFKMSGCTSTPIAGGINIYPPGGVVASVMWNPLGTQLAVGYGTSPYVSLYSWNSGTETLTKLADPATVPTASALNVVFSDDGSMLAVAAGTGAATQSLFVYTTSGGLSALTFASPLLNDIGRPAWSSDGSLAISDRLSANIRYIYERNAGAMDLVTTYDDTINGWDVDWDPTGAFVAFGGNSAPYVHTFYYDGATLTLQDQPSPGWSEGMAQPVNNNGLLFSPDGAYLAGPKDIFTTGILDTPFVLTLSPLSASEILARWPTQANAAYYKTYAALASGFTIGESTYKSNTTQLGTVFTGLPQNTELCARAQVYNATHVVIATSPEACGSTSYAALTFYGNTTRVVPDNVTLYIVRPNGQEYLVDCVRLDPGGAIQNACTVDTWSSGESNNYSFRYPQSIVANTSNGDTGEYLLYVVNETGRYVGGVTFCVQSTWSGSCNVTIGPDLEVQLGSSSVAEAAGISAEQEVAINKATEIKVRGAFLHFLDVLFRSDVFIPNILWGYVVMVAVGIIGIGTNARRST